MKQKSLFGLLAMGAMMFTTSCQEEDMFGGSSVADTDVVTFTVNTQQVATRALAGQGTAAGSLYYGVYEFIDKDSDGAKEWVLIPAISKTETPHESFTAADGALVQIRLAKQKEYSIIFWAETGAEGDGLCNVDWDARSMSVNSEVSSNQEDYDAFWAYDHIKSFTGALTKEVSLVRPFAQLNIGVSNEDWDAAVAAGAEVKESAVTVKGVPTTMSLVDGTVSGEGDVAYASAAIPSHADWTFPVDGYKYLALNCVLVCNEQQLVDIDLAYTDVHGDDYSNAFTAVPVKRNHRTNIYGDLLTGNADYNVKIEAGINTPDINGDEDNTVRTSVATAAELQAAIDAATTGLTVISFENDITANTTRSASTAMISIVQKEGVNLVIDGRQYKFDGKILVNGNARAKGEETLTFTNIQFETASAENFTFVEAPSKVNNKYNYSHNVTLDNCAFAYTGSEGAEIGSASFTGTYNLVMKNCTATNMHSILQTQSCDNNVTVDNVTTVNCKNGVSFGNTAYPKLSNSTINATVYGVRADGNASRGNLIVENTTVTAEKPIIVRKLTTKTYNVTLGDEVALNTSATYHVAFTNGDDEAEYVVPTGAYTLTGAESFNVYPAEDEKPLVATSAAQLKSFLANDAIDQILLGATTFEGAFEVKRPVTIKSVDADNKATIKGRVDVSADASFNNIKFDVNNDSKAKNVFSGTNYQYPSTANIYAAAASFDGCEFKVSRADNVTAINYGSHAAGKMLTVNDCSFKGDFYAIRSRTLFCVTNSDFDIHTDETLAAVFTWGNGNSGANSVTFTGNTNTSGYKTMGVMLSSKTFTYDKIHFDVQDNTDFVKFSESINPACSVTDCTFAEGSEQF